MEREKYIERFFEYLKIEKNFSHNTIINYKKDISTFLTIVKKDFDKINHFDIRNFLSYLLKKKYKRTSIARKIATLRTLFRFFLREGIVNTNPLVYISSFQKEKNIPVFLDIPEVEILLTLPDITTLSGLRNKAVLETLYGTGIRVSELINLRVDDIDGLGGVVKVKGKRNKERIIPIGEKALESIESYLNHPERVFFETEKAIFLNLRGKKITSRSITRIVKKYVNLASIQKKVSPHTFRHSFATHLMNAGCTLRAIQEMLGHSSLSTTQIYTHVTVNKLKKVYEKAHPRS